MCLKVQQQQRYMEQQEQMELLSSLLKKESLVNCQSILTLGLLTTVHGFRPKCKMNSPREMAEYSASIHHRAGVLKYQVNRLLIGPANKLPSPHNRITSKVFSEIH